MEGSAFLNMESSLFFVRFGSAFGASVLTHAAERISEKSSRDRYGSAYFKKARQYDLVR